MHEHGVNIHLGKETLTELLGCNAIEHAQLGQSSNHVFVLQAPTVFLIECFKLLGRFLHHGARV
jgi:hypothetical protein